MTENTILSIIIPVYNGENYIDRCVSAIIREYCPKVELLLVDDGSEDSSLKKCNSWHSAYKWIRVLHHENHGVSYTRNKGMREARGKYIWFVDVDDIILQDSIKLIVKIVENEEPDILLFGYRSKLARKQLNNFDTNPSKQGRYLIEKDISDLFWELLGKNLIHNIGNKVYSAEILQRNNVKFDEGLAIYEDALFCVNAMKNAKSLSIYSCAWYCYNLEENSQSLNHIYRKNYFIGVSFLYENIAQLLKTRDKQYYTRFLGSVINVIENEFRQKGYRYFEFREFVLHILTERNVREALEQINLGIELDKRLQLLLNKKYCKCYFLFKYEYKKKKIFESKIVGDIFDLVYYVYKKQPFFGIMSL